MVSNLLTVDEAAAILVVKRARIYDLCRRRMLPVVRIGRQVRFDSQALLDWISQGGTLHLNQAERMNDDKKIKCACDLATSRHKHDNAKSG